MSASVCSFTKEYRRGLDRIPPVANIGATCAAIFCDWLPESGETVAEGPLMMIEHYDETFDPHTGLGGIAVWVPLEA